VVPEAEQGGLVVGGDQPDVAAGASVTAVGTTLGDVGFTTERHTARATVTRLDVDLGLVYEP
jgi:hypothetical protein